MTKISFIHVFLFIYLDFRRYKIYILENNTYNNHTLSPHRIIKKKTSKAQTQYLHICSIGLSI